ncbi:hypothetical protein GCM10027024_18970 [Microbacterium insulae]
MTDVVVPVDQLPAGQLARALQVMDACVMESPRAAITLTPSGGRGAACAADEVNRVPEMMTAAAARLASARRALEEERMR